LIRKGVSQGEELLGNPAHPARQQRNQDHCHFSVLAAP